MKAWLLALAVLAGGCALRDPTANQTIVDLERDSAASLVKAPAIKVGVPEPGDAASQVLEIVVSELEEKGYKVARGPVQDEGVDEPFLLVDAERVQDKTLVPGVAGRLALRLPKQEGEAFSHVFFALYIFHRDDEEAQERHLRRAIRQALEGFAERR